MIKEVEEVVKEVGQRFQFTLRPKDTSWKLLSQFNCLPGVRLLVTHLYPEWKEGGEVLSSLVESCQCTDSQTLQDICSLFGGEVWRSLKNKLFHQTT